MLAGGFWWTSTVDGTANAWRQTIWYSSADVKTDSDNQKNGFSVRCLKE
jgi:uncharacterized protein (TIGR02145 family)